MRIKRIGSTGAAMSLIALGLVVAPSPAHAGILLDRWASQTGMPTDDCTHADPCDIVTAINDAPHNSTVHITPGIYGTKAEPLATGLDAEGPMTIVASKPKTPPVIYSQADSALLTRSTAVSDLVIVSTGATTGLYLNNSIATRIASYATAGSYGACNVYGSTLTDSLCMTSETDTGAVAMNEGGGVDPITDHAVLDGVTAIATGPHSAGMRLTADNNLALTVDVKNSIIRGKQFDVQANAYAGGNVTVTLNHSAYRPSKQDVTAPATATGNATDIATTPKFTNPAVGDYSERRTSPTIDGGAPEPANALDLARNPRTLGHAPDIGSSEFRARPTAGHLKLVKIKHHVATFTVMVNPQGLRTHVHLLARHNAHRVASTAVNAGRGRKARRLTIHVTLAPGTKYHVRAKAKNLGGTTLTKNVHLKTP